MPLRMLLLPPLVRLHFDRDLGFAWLETHGIQLLEPLVATRVWKGCAAPWAVENLDIRTATVMYDDTVLVELRAVDEENVSALPGLLMIWANDRDLVKELVTAVLGSGCRHLCPSIYIQLRNSSRLTALEVSGGISRRLHRGIRRRRANAIHTRAFRRDAPFEREAFFAPCSVSWHPG